MSQTAKLLHLHPTDNIAVLAQDVVAGAVARYRCDEFLIGVDLIMGHKIALVDIPRGADVVKYGCPIGFAAKDISAGDHVHLHNIQSRYTKIKDMSAGQS